MFGKRRSGTCFWTPSHKIPKLATNIKSTFRKIKHRVKVGQSTFNTCSLISRISTFAAKHLPEANITDGLATWLNSAQLSTAQHSSRGARGRLAIVLHGICQRFQGTFEDNIRAVLVHGSRASVFWEHGDPKEYQNHRIQKCQMDEMGDVGDKKKD